MCKQRHLAYFDFGPILWENAHALKVKAAVAVEVETNWITAHLLRCLEKPTRQMFSEIFFRGHFNDFCHATMQSQCIHTLAKEFCSYHKSSQLWWKKH